ncbi:uncharacterized protein [Pseudochaenichthys georgianus]|uniref:uncharacterized protein isoform X2 n=1 Tax=Pseudochaenichthys georgianus TaxID=52239 RepID=UPI0039C19780
MATMSSVEFLREFVNERLSAAAEEIFGVFQKTIVNYEEEIRRQRRLLDVVLKPEINIHRIELPQHPVCEEQVLSEQQLCIQERNSSLDQEDPEPPQIKEEQEELCTSPEGEQLGLEQDTDAYMLTATEEASEHQLHNSHVVAESQDQEGVHRLSNKVEELLDASQGLEEVTRKISDIVAASQDLVVPRPEVKQAFSRLICRDTMTGPMFSSCCRSIVGCRLCVEEWRITSPQCLKCRDQEPVYTQVAGLSAALDALRALP